MPPTIAVFDMGTFTVSTEEMAGEEEVENAYGALLDGARAFTLTDRGAAVVSGLARDISDATHRKMSSSVMASTSASSIQAVVCECAWASGPLYDLGRHDVHRDLCSA